MDQKTQSGKSGGDEKSFRWDVGFIRRNDTSAPRYTSYPTALQFHEEFTVQNLREEIDRSNAAHRPLSLYFHIPFCDTICYYCACNKIVTANKARAADYLKYLAKELELKSPLFASNRPVVQLHWGGGTPTFLSDSEMTELMHLTARYFQLLPDDQGEYSIEIDPRTADLNKLSLVRGLGFNRISLGVQDFDEKVQKSVNRMQSLELVQEVTSNARGLGFKSVNFDLIYGLPNQTVGSFRETVERVVELEPDRIALYNYAHLPARFKTQRQILAEELPEPEEKLSIMVDAANALLDNGYVYIGMDHFAKEGDELVKARDSGNLQRNFQGYSTCRPADIVGFGVSAISSIGNCYAQNHHTLPAYEEALDEDLIPVEKGVMLNEDDLVRSKVIMNLLCYGKLDFSDIDKEFGIDCLEYFREELEAMKTLKEEGFVYIFPGGIHLTNLGQVFARKVAQVFDRYQRRSQQASSFSKII